MPTTVSLLRWLLIWQIAHLTKCTACLIKCVHLTNLHTVHAWHFVEIRFRVGLGLRFGLGLGLRLGLMLGSKSFWSNANLPDAQRIWSNAQIDQMRLNNCAVCVEIRIGILCLFVSLRREVSSWISVHTDYVKSSENGGCLVFWSWVLLTSLRKKKN